MNQITTGANQSGVDQVGMVLEIERLIVRYQQGDETALERLAELAYWRLKRIAAAVIGQRWDHPSLSPTVLVHEGFLKLFEADAFRGVRDAGHFFSLFARAMKQQLCDYERKRGAQKRGKGFQRVELAAVYHRLQTSELSFVELDDTITQLERRDAEAAITAEAIRLKVFAMMTVPEIADALRIKPSVVERHLRIGRAYLTRVLLTNDSGNGRMQRVARESL